MKTILVCLVLSLSAITLHSQVFAFVQNEADHSAAENVSGYKYKVAQKIFDQLLQARGDYRLQAPTLAMNKRERYVAWMDPDLVQIGLEEKAYDICVSFGKDSLTALAALLAHELTHYYEKHDWSRHFVRENENIETAKQLDRLEEGLKQEAQADCLGGFLAFSAGFDTYGIMPDLLKKIYQSYHLPADLTGYPPLSDRLSMSEAAMGQLQGLSIVFETATLLSILGNYADASAYYRTILQTYQSREVYNNAGVSMVLEALKYFVPAEMPYALPLELDPKTRLRNARSGESDRLEKRQLLLQTALGHFERALTLDENYATGYLNKACTLALLGNFEDAEFLLKKGKRKAGELNSTSDFLVLEGIIAAMQDYKEMATEKLTQAQKQGNYWAQLNLNVLQGVPNATAPVEVSPVIGVEQIEQFDLGRFLAAPKVDREVPVVDNIVCGVHQLKYSRVRIHYADNGKHYAVAQQTAPDYTGATLRGIVLGTTQDKVLAAYGSPKQVVALPGGLVWVYPNSNLFFQFDAQSKVDGWSVYQVSAE